MSQMNRRRLLLAAGSGLLLSQAGLPLSARAAEGIDRKAAGAAHGPHAAATPTAGKSATAGTSHAASRAASRPLRVGFLYDGPIDPYSASHLHALSAQYLKRQLGNRIELVPAERVTEGKDADRVLRKMCADGCQLVFGTAYGFMDAIVRVARDYPSVRFESNVGFKTADNVGTYNARYYQARYLAGMLAAHASSREIGRASCRERV